MHLKHRHLKVVLGLGLKLGDGGGSSQRRAAGQRDGHPGLRMEVQGWEEQWAILQRPTQRWVGHGWRSTREATMGVQ